MGDWWILYSLGIPEWVPSIAAAIGLVTLVIVAWKMK